METINLKVTGMTCGSCVKHVEKALSAVPGVQAVVVDLSAGTASVTGDLPGDASSLLAALDADGYPSTIGLADVASTEQGKGGGCGGQSCCCH
ncbi:heavy-metal-associated domain-containing protein [Polynucleobacter sp. MWH-UH25E]|uniref:heavy-metal-associated domain-containing protein n=1 Tax=Polynucleobacter sp. MWH-UH25E TaxID=1855616 RepID=UPI001BFD01AE|nr:heavy metal-associated domain-containing protein [Polynucleobacter sp. MWH-UH25E]QWD62607.1 heavy-metal-associated domain-containing protein [Polynucleobacter sp. MWH-UH25E]